MNTAALFFIECIASTMAELDGIKAALEDGEALATLGVTDDDQPMVDEAHSIVVEWIAAGHTTWEQATGRV